MTSAKTFISRAAWIVAPLLVFVAVYAALALAKGPDPAPSSVAGPSAATSRADTRTLVATLRDAVASDPGDAAAAAALGDAYYQRSRETGDGRFLELAESSYANALAADPESAAALAGRATIALAEHRFADGLALARRAHRAAPELVAPYAPLVDGLIETGRYREAAGALEQMLNRKPTLAAYSRVSYYRELLGDLDGAAQALRLAISAGSGTAEGNAYVRSLLGDLEAVRGRDGAAARAYRSALAIDPGHGRSQVGLALLRAGRGQLAPAIASVRAQPGLSSSPDLLTTLGELEQAAGRFAAAREHYTLASQLEREGLRAGAGYDAGVTLNEAEHGDRETAVEYGRRAWRSAPSVNSADAYSWALYRAGQIRAAVQLSAEAMRLGSRDPSFRFHAGMIAIAAGEDQRGRRLLEALLERTPGFNPLYAEQARRALEDLR